jgi:hypothetical protein
MRIEIDDTVLIDTIVEKVVERNKKSLINNDKSQLLMRRYNSVLAIAGILRRNRVL